jgi:hypothetical protein
MTPTDRAKNLAAWVVVFGGGIGLIVLCHVTATGGVR